jgi:hypothetical protein
MALLLPTAAAASCPFDALPVPLLSHIFALLPVDARARCAAVCRGWCAVVADPALWHVLDLSPAGGLHRRVMPPALVREAAARAGGQLRVLTLFHTFCGFDDRVVDEVLAANAASLRELNGGPGRYSSQRLRALLAAAPHLDVLTAHVFDHDLAELCAMLRNEPPFGLLRADGVSLHVFGAARPEQVLDVAAAVAANVWVKTLIVYTLELDPAVLNALLDAAFVRRLADLALRSCRLTTENVTVLTRLLHCGSLTRLDISYYGQSSLLGEQAMVQLGAALRGARSLMCLWLSGIDLFQYASYGAVLDAVPELPALTKLNLALNQIRPPASRAAAGRAMGALLAADPPSLRVLNVMFCGLRDDGMAPLLDGLAANTQLRQLRCDDSAHNGAVSDAFWRDRLAPALAALAARPVVPAYAAADK